jgi:hypothetical protein
MVFRVQGLHMYNGGFQKGSRQVPGQRLPSGGAARFVGLGKDLDA